MATSRDTGWQRLACFVATAGGVGLLPRAPGTFGTLVGLVVAYGLALASTPWRGGLSIGLLGLAWLAADVAGRAYGSSDDQRIVIDEVLGICVAAMPLGSQDSIGFWCATFLMFRYFDIKKPWPIGWLEANVGGAWGCLIDDVAAGIATALLVGAVHAWFLSVM